ncbi:MAG: MG2 domain-containing protein, partial [Myxococcales bacterium]|nr:MG2 domain-containing protein [Myxococcales bacterium]
MSISGSNRAIVAIVVFCVAAPLALLTDASCSNRAAAEPVAPSPLASPEPSGPLASPPPLLARAQAQAEPPAALARSTTPAPRPCSEALGPPGLLEARVLCEACEPAAAVLELTFDRVVDAAQIVASIHAEPAVSLHSRSSRCARRVLVGGAFESQRRYALSYAAGAEPARSFAILTGGGRPVLHMPSPMAVLRAAGSLPMQLEGVAEARLRALAIGEDEIPRAAELGGRHPAGSDPLVALPEAWLSRVRERRVASLEGDALGVQEVDVFDLAGVESGVVLVVLDAPGASSLATLVQRSNHSLMLKLGSRGGLVWLADLAAGRSAPGASITIWRGRERLHRGRTDGSGLLRIPPELEGRGGGGRERGPLRVVARIGSEIAYATEEFETGIQPWSLLPESYSWGSPRARGMVTAERGIYRPGETVHLLGILRELRGDGTLRAPRGEVQLEIRDPDGGIVGRTSVVMTRFGTFREAIEIPPGARLGRYQVDARWGETQLMHRFEVGEYRADTFEVELPPSGPVEQVDGQLVLPIRARYLHGAPVRSARVDWSVSSRTRLPSVPGAEGFAFAGADRYEGMGGGRAGGIGSHARHEASASLTLDPEGRAEIRLPLEELSELSEAQVRDLLFEVQVLDVAGDVVTARTVQTQAARGVLLGLRSDRW